MRRVRDRSCADTRIYLYIEVRGVYCRSCGKVKRERLDFPADNPLYTKRFAWFVGRRCRQSTVKDVACELNLDWHTAKELDKQYMRIQVERAGTPGSALTTRLGECDRWWGLHHEDGTPVEGIELTRFTYHPAAWSKPRWVVGIRQHITQRAEPKGKTLNLFANDPVMGQWRFSALTTDLDLPAVEVWRLYRGRADCENRLKELNTILPLTIST
jgi:hypothetical protein